MRMLKVVVLRNVFDPREFDEDAARILEYSGRLREHCAKFGRVTKVVVYDKHEDGVAQVFFGTPEEADMAISMLDGRVFSNKKVMKAATWDGKEKFKVVMNMKYLSQYHLILLTLNNQVIELFATKKVSFSLSVVDDAIHSRWPRPKRRRKRGWPTGTSFSTKATIRMTSARESHKRSKRVTHDRGIVGRHSLSV